MIIINKIQPINTFNSCRKSLALQFQPMKMSPNSHTTYFPLSSLACQRETVQVLNTNDIDLL